ncbi:MAG TPA: hypothetical protein VLK82_01180 [Candidatus Tectomicrobia bacterium]|nr:hypothetical protein [Candidatus Tectomicrobia bacterium]
MRRRKHGHRGVTRRCDNAEAMEIRGQEDGIDMWSQLVDLFDRPPTEGRFCLRALSPIRQAFLLLAKLVSGVACGGATG